MRAQIGRIIYLGGCIGSATIVALAVAGILLNIGDENGAAIVRTLTIAALAWGAGRFALYALTGR
jgi:hypothetical protein